MWSLLAIDACLPHGSCFSAQIDGKSAHYTVMDNQGDRATRSAISIGVFCSRWKRTDNPSVRADLHRLDDERITIGNDRLAVNIELINRDIASPLKMIGADFERWLITESLDTINGSDAVDLQLGSAGLLWPSLRTDRLSL
jgi:hypothetical protein